MNWTNIKLILAREIRDQLRDWRTMFMIVVMPILLYPLMMTVTKISQLAQDAPSRVLVIGARNLPEEPALVENSRFAPGLFSTGEKSRLLEITFEGDEPRAPGEAPPDLRARARAAVQEGRFEAALCIPPDFADRLEKFQEAVRRQAGHAADRPANGLASAALGVPKPEVFYSTAEKKSQTAFALLSAVLTRWADVIGRNSLAAAGVPAAAAAPVEAEAFDVAAETGHRGAALWSAVLPVLLMIWALTGAFYPAVDLCAGEKERGTLETLLSSPARRSEIVLGKLATIMLFSGITALLNLGGMVLLAWMVFARGFGMPPVSAVVWLPLALVPITALFSALCLALAAFARSTKEGQYYLMPLLLLTLPLAVVPAVTGMELNLGNSLIPVTGIVLVLREALEGNSWHAIEYLPPVVGVTLLACWFAIRWAVDQFNKESVLFRESERLDLRLWVLHLVHDRRPTPSAAAAVFCGVLVLVIQYFLSMAMKVPTDFAGFALLTLATQLVVIVAPTVLMTVMLTSNPRATLLLRLPAWRTVPAAVLLAVALQPIVRGLEALVMWLYPFPQQVQEQLADYLGVLRDASLWQVVLLLALVPAVCEELAFRGFILSGFRQPGTKWRAIACTAVFFGLSHPILQQSLITCLVGLAIGLLAVQTRSLLPGIAFHFTHNALTLASTSLGELPNQWPTLGFLLRRGESGRIEFEWPAVAAGAAASAALLWWFARLPSDGSVPEPGADAELEAA